MAYGITDRDIPNFVKARSPQGLRRAMLRNNAKYGMFHKYFDIQFVQGSWYAWFFTEIDAQDELLKVQTKEVE